MNSPTHPPDKSQETAAHYDELPYGSGACVESHPDRLATIARLCGIEPAPVERCRVLEIGCAEGGNLLPLATAYPESQFIGLDLSARQIDQAGRAATTLALPNIRFEQTDFRAAGLDGEFDYVIAHGVYSWIPDEVRRELLPAIRNWLAPAGIAFVSMNTLPGWHLRQQFREMMQYHGRQATDTHTRVARGWEMVDLLARHLPADSPAGPLRREAERIRGLRQEMLAHDLLEPDQRAFYLHEFVDDSTRAGLQFLGDAEFQTMLPQNWPRDLVEEIDGFSSTLVEMEQYFDFVRGRMFRRSLLCRQDLALNRQIGPQTVVSLRAASALQPEVPLPDLRSASSLQPVVFQNKEGGRLQTASAAAMVALNTLAACWPESRGIVELTQAAVSALAPHERTPAEESGLANACAAEIAQAVLAGWCSQLVELRSTVDRFSAQSPQAEVRGCPYARLQALTSGQVANRRHQMLRLEDDDRALLAQLDGSKLLSSFSAADQQSIGRLARAALLVE